jgi:predicted DCC family thiol-disulfide oxidoreductase YuxK
MISNDLNIILFDGVCNFCNFWADFIIKRDMDEIFKFASLQSDAGKTIAEKFLINRQDIDSIILIKGENYFIKSEAALEVVKELKSIWKIFYLLKVIPRPLRDFIYDLIARNRYAFFGKRDTCRVPAREEMSRFII